SGEKSAPPQQNSNQDSIVFANESPIKNAQSAAEVCKDNPGKERSEFVAAEAHSQMSVGLEIMPAPVEPTPTAIMTWGERMEFPMEVEQQGVSVIPNIEIQMKENVKGLVEAKTVSTWRRKQKSVGRLVRVVSDNGEMKASSGLNNEDGAATSMKRSREVVLYKGESQGSEESAEKKVKVDGADDKVEKASLKWPQDSILVQPIEEKEIKAALFLMESDKAPGEDGMTVFFFKHFWNIIKDDICAAVKSFFLSGNMLKNWKHTVITLIPKCLYPDSLSNFRPISLCGVLYKVVAKIIAERLKLCLNSCISSAQTAFVPGRSLLDNVVIAQEVLHYLHRHRSRPHAFMAVKLDMEKAYDRVEWSCIKVIMRKMGFYGKFVNWIL
ncbi:DNAse I-like superfamily protein, partial [Striga hermonthica]